jgi:aspartate aminotransferase
VNGVFQLDVQKVIDACDADTKLIYLASPGNPTGWTIPEIDAQALLEFSRKSGIPIISDEVYQRLSFHSDPGFTFLSIADPDDSLFVVNSFSKSWSMTGWRLGWMVYPDWFHDTFEKLSQFSISGSPGFLQQGAVAALDCGEDYVTELRVQAMNSSQYIEILCLK